MTYTANSVANTARFVYDSFGEPRGFILNNEKVYLYLKNGQGDITAIVGETGEILVRYEYNAWGAVEFVVPFGVDPAVTSILATVSPFTYRGYCYDYDIGMYYLQSRYYDPQICRFINADSTDYLGATGTVLSYNLFAYCENDGVNRVDKKGNASINLKKTKSNVFTNMARGLLMVWSDGRERKIISVSNSSVTMYLSVSVGTSIGKLKTVSFSSKSITISGKNFSTTLGAKKITYSLWSKIGKVSLKFSVFVGSKGYGFGISVISPIYSTKNKKIGEVSVNIVLESTYLVLGAVAVTVAGACVVYPMVVPVAKQMIKTFSVLTQPRLVLAYVYTFYKMINSLAVKI